MPPKVVVITGPTATGKTALAVELAKLYNGEVVSADSMVRVGTGIFGARDYGPVR